MAYGDYFVSLIVHLKRNNKRINEIPFKDELISPSKTIFLYFEYLYYLRYCLTLIFCIIKKFLNVK